MIIVNDGTLLFENKSEIDNLIYPLEICIDKMRINNHTRDYLITVVGFLARMSLNYDSKITIK